MLLIIGLGCWLVKLEAARRPAGLFFLAWDTHAEIPAGPGTLVIRATWPGPGDPPPSRGVEVDDLSPAEFEALALEIERRGLGRGADRPDDAARVRLASLSDATLVALAFRDYAA